MSRKAAQRVLVTRPYGDRTGYVSRQALERDGEVWYRAGREHLYATCERAQAIIDAHPRKPRGRRDLRELRRAMADAHPDRGGTNEEFIAARERYERALRQAS